MYGRFTSSNFALRFILELLFSKISIPAVRITQSILTNMESFKPQAAYRSNNNKKNLKNQITSNKATQNRSVYQPQYRPWAQYSAKANNLLPWNCFTLTLQPPFPSQRKCPHSKRNQHGKTAVDFNIPITEPTGGRY